MHANVSSYPMPAFPIVDFPTAIFADFPQLLILQDTCSTQTVSKHHNLNQLTCHPLNLTDCLCFSSQSVAIQEILQTADDMYSN